MHTKNIEHEQSCSNQLKAQQETLSFLDTVLNSFKAFDKMVKRELEIEEGATLLKKIKIRCSKLTKAVLEKSDQKLSEEDMQTVNGIKEEANESKE